MTNGFVSKGNCGTRPVGCKTPEFDFFLPQLIKGEIINIKRFEG